MKNDELFRSLSRMAEEYDRLVSPLYTILERIRDEKFVCICLCYNRTAIS